MQQTNQVNAEAGQTWNIKCGWGWTRAILESKHSVSTALGEQVRYNWIAGNFRFCSYDLEDSVLVKEVQR